MLSGALWNVCARGLSGLVSAGSGLGIGFVLYIPLYFLRATGARDVRLPAAVGATMGPSSPELDVTTTAGLRMLVADHVILHWL